MDRLPRNMPAGGGWLSGLAALLLHGAVALALPSGRPAEAVAPPQSQIWLSVEAAPAGPEASGAPGREPSESAAAVARPKPARRVVRRPAQHAALPTQSPLVAKPRPGDEGAEAPSPSPRVATADAAAASDAAAEGDALSAGASEPGDPASEALAPGEGFAESSSAGDAAAERAKLAAGSSCAGYFPASADAGAGVVRLRVHVGPDGNAGNCEVLSESPRDQGFGRAALACARRLHFAPAHDVRGAPVEDDTTLELGFRRL